MDPLFARGSALEFATIRRLVPGRPTNLTTNAVGPSLKLERHSTAIDVARRAADLFAEEMAANPRAVCLLPAGNTPRPLFTELLKRHAEGALDLSQFTAVQLDEVLGLGPSDSASFNAFLRRELLDHLDREPKHNLLLDGGAADPTAEIEAHAKNLASRGSTDLAILGLGGNGHLAFNEPGSKRQSPARRVDLDEATKEALESGGRTEGITLGLTEILAARRILLLVTGAGKAQVLTRLLDSKPTADLPASFLHQCGSVTVIADDAALG